MKKFLEEIKFSVAMVVAGAVVMAIALGLSFGLLKLIGEDLLDFLAGIMLAGFVAAAVAIVAFYLFRFFTKPRSEAPIFAAIVVVLIVMGMHMLMTVELKGIKKEFLSVAKTADYKILWGQGENHPEKGTATNPITYNGKLDAVIAKRNAFLKKWGFVGFGDWRVGDSREVQFQMAYVFCPLVKL